MTKLSLLFGEMRKKTDAFLKLQSLSAGKELLELARIAYLASGGDGYIAEKFSYLESDIKNYLKSDLAGRQAAILQDIDAICDWHGWKEKRQISLPRKYSEIPNAETAIKKDERNTSIEQLQKEAGS